MTREEATGNSKYICPICGADSLCAEFTDGMKWGRSYCNSCDCCGPEVRTGYDGSIDAEWRAEAIECFKSVIDEHVSKRFSRWVKTSDRLPTTLDTDELGKLPVLIKSALNGDLLRASIYYESVTPDSVDYFLPLPRSPEAME